MDSGGKITRRGYDAKVILAMLKTFIFRMPKYFSNGYLTNKGTALAENLTKSHIQKKNIKTIN